MKIFLKLVNYPFTFMKIPMKNTEMHVYKLFSANNTT